jgi:prolyl-tRNA synthetase
VLADTGESQVYCHRDYLGFDVPAAGVNYDDDAEVAGIVDKWTTPYAATDEMHDEAAWNAIDAGNQVSARGIEVGHIFHFGTKYSEPMGAKVLGPDGKEHVLSMGSYGIGPSRLMAAIIEASHDDNGIIWPKSVAPFDASLINMKVGNEGCDAMCATIETAYANAGLEVLYDDSDKQAGGKFATADLIGLPTQIIVGPRGAASGEVEIKDRKSGERHTLPLDAAIKALLASHGKH